MNAPVLAHRLHQMVCSNPQPPIFPPVLALS